MTVGTTGSFFRNIIVTRGGWRHSLCVRTVQRHQQQPFRWMFLVTAATTTTMTTFTTGVCNNNDNNIINKNRGTSCSCLSTNDSRISSTNTNASSTSNGDNSDDNSNMLTTCDTFVVVRTLESKPTLLCRQESLLPTQITLSPPAVTTAPTTTIVSNIIRLRGGGGADISDDDGGDNDGDDDGGGVGTNEHQQFEETDTALEENLISSTTTTTLQQQHSSDDGSSQSRTVSSTLLLLLPFTTATTFIGNVLRTCSHQYTRNLERYPIRTKSISASVIFALSDIMAQVLTKPPPQTNDTDDDNASNRSSTTTIVWTQVLMSAAVGLLYFGPAAHYWYNYMFRILPLTNLWSTIQKAVLGQLLFGPTFACIFFATSLIQTNNFTIANWGEKIQRDLPSTWMAGAGYWSVVDLVSYSYISPPYIPLFANICSFFWTTYLVVKSYK